MTDAHRIAMEALQRAKCKRTNPLREPSKAEIARQLEQALAERNCLAVVYAPQPIPSPKKPRPVTNLKALAFAEVLADGAALMAARA